MRVLVPFDPRNPKTRLAASLDENERREFARAMLNDVVKAIRGTGITPEVLTPTHVNVRGASVLVDDRRLSPAVNAKLDAARESIAVVMADLPLVTQSVCSRLFGTEGEVVLARGIGGGTNALVTRHPDFEVDYHGASYLDHLAAAENCGASVTELDSFRLGLDIDELGDVPEVFLHGSGQAYEWLRNAGFQLDAGDGRVAIERTEESNDVGAIKT